LNTVPDAALQAFRLVTTLDPKLVEIVGLSLRVSVGAAFFGALIGLPLGAAIAVNVFRGRHALIVILNALMGLPSVVVGLVVYLLLSRAGPLGSWGILFTPTAMVIAQTILIAPTLAALAQQRCRDADAQAETDDFEKLRVQRGDQLKSLQRRIDGAVQRCSSSDRTPALTAIYANICNFTCGSSVSDDDNGTVASRLNMHRFT